MDMGKPMKEVCKLLRFQKPQTTMWTLLSPFGGFQTSSWVIQTALQKSGPHVQLRTEGRVRSVRASPPLSLLNLREMQIQEHLFLEAGQRHTMKQAAYPLGHQSYCKCPSFFSSASNSFSKMCCDETLGTESVSGNVRQPPSVITSWLWDHT